MDDFSTIATPVELRPPKADFSSIAYDAYGHAKAVAIANGPANAASAGSAAKIAKQLGIPQVAVETDLPSFTTKAKVEKNTSLLDQNPILARWVAANPDAARIANDDYEKLSLVEKTFEAGKLAGYGTAQGLGGAYSATGLAVNRTLAPIASAVGAGDWWRQKMIAPLEANQKAFEERGGFFQGLGQVIGSIGGLLSQISFTGGGQVAIPETAGVMTNIALSVQNAMKSMAIPAATAAVNTGAEIYKATGDPTETMKASAISAANMVGIGVVPLSAAGNVLRRAYTGAIANAAQSEATRAAWNIVMPEQFRRQFDPQQFATDVATGLVMGAAMGPRPDVNVPLREAMREVYRKSVDAQQAIHVGEMIDTVTDIVADVNLKKASPEDFARFMQGVTEKTALEALYVDPTVLGEALAQSKVDVATMPDVAKQMAEPVPGGDVRISVADFVAHIAGTDAQAALTPHLKASPEGMTRAEGESFYKNLAPEMEKRAKELSTLTEEQQKYQAETEAIQKMAYDELTVGGKRSPTVAKVGAKVFESFVTTNAEKIGASRLEFAKRINPKVITDALDGDPLLQPAYHGSPHDFKKFDSSKIGTGEGAQAFGHGLYFAENRGVAAGYYKALAEAPGLKEMRIGSLSVSERNNFDYTRKAHVSDLENIRASLAEDMMIRETELLGISQDEFRKTVLERLDEKIADYERGGNSPEFIRAAKDLRKILERPGALSVAFHEAAGGVYQVDITDESVATFLLWDKPLSEQPEAVKNALEAVKGTPAWERLNDAQLGGPVMEQAVGRDLYRHLAESFAKYHDDLGDQDVPPNIAAIMQRHGIPGDIAPGQSITSMLAQLYAEFGAKLSEQERIEWRAEIANSPDASASAYLNSIGIKGIKYLDAGSRDTGGTSNLVVFDDSIIKLTHKNGEPVTQEERDAYVNAGGDALYQPKRGQINLPLKADGTVDFNQGRPLISLLKDANLSTYSHELGHLFVEVYSDIAFKPDGPLAIKKDLQTLLDYAGIKDNETWRSMTINEKRIAHEKIAESFEQYLWEGKAPSVELRGVFRKIKSWMKSIYRSLKGLGVELTPEVRGVFDRMLASDAAIAEANAKYPPLFKTAEEAGMTPSQFEAYMALDRDKVDAALEEIDARSLRDMKWLSNAKSRTLREMQRKGDSLRAEVRDEVAAEVDQMPVFMALDDINQSMPAFKERLDAWKADSEAVKRQAQESVIRAEADAEQAARAWDETNPQPQKPQPKGEKEVDIVTARKRQSILKAIGECL